MTERAGSGGPRRRAPKEKPAAGNQQPQGINFPARDSGRDSGREEIRREDRRDDRKPRPPMARIGDLLPHAARQFGLEDELELANMSAAWLRLIAERVPAAAGECRLTGFSQGVATITADQAIVAQEIRLRAPELLSALRSLVPAPVRQIRVLLRHV